jgi:hypothetical protein
MNAIPRVDFSLSPKDSKCTATAIVAIPRLKKKTQGRGGKWISQPRNFESASASATATVLRCAALFWCYSSSSGFIACSMIQSCAISALKLNSSQLNSLSTPSYKGTKTPGSQLPSLKGLNNNATRARHPLVPRAA